MSRTFALLMLLPACCSCPRDDADGPFAGEEWAVSVEIVEEAPCPLPPDPLGVARPPRAHGDLARPGESRRLPPVDDRADRGR